MTGATSTGTAAPITAASAGNASGNAYTVTFTAVNSLTAGNGVALSNLTGNFASLNGSVQTVLSVGLSTAQFEITAYNLSGTTGSSAGTATPLALKRRS